MAQVETDFRQRYHIREAWATAAQELAFTLRNGIEYVRYAIDAGLDVATCARASLFSSITTTTFSRRSPSSAPHGAYGRGSCAIASRQHRRDRGSCAFTPRPAGVSLSAQQPYNKRGANGLAGDGRGPRRDSVPPYERARRSTCPPDRGSRDVALRTQQIIAHETTHRSRRSAWWPPITSIADRPARERGDGLLLDDRRHGRDGGGDRRGLPSTGDCRERLSAQQAIETKAQHCRCERLVEGGATASARSTSRDGGERQLARLAEVRKRRDAARGPQGRGSPAGLGRRRCEHDAAARRCLRAYATIGESAIASERSGVSTSRPRLFSLPSICARKSRCHCQAGLDGHDSGAKVIRPRAAGRRHGGNLSGLRQTPEQIVGARPAGRPM